MSSELIEAWKNSSVRFGLFGVDDGPIKKYLFHFLVGFIAFKTYRQFMAEFKKNFDKKSDGDGKGPDAEFTDEIFGLEMKY